jgi:two-component system chemotaxis response regulator CheB
MHALKSIAAPSTFTCPDCGGVLFELNDKRPIRFRCHTGHGFSLRSLAFTQEEITDSALWAGLRALQEKEAILRRLAEAQGAGAHTPGRLAALAEADALAKAAAGLRQLTLHSPGPKAFD